jgi:DNA repair exonuclease SbcCD ATPase subunit
VFVSEEIQHLHNDKRAAMSRLEAMNNEVSETSSLPIIRQNIVVGLQRYSHLKDTLKKLRKHYVAGRAFEDKISKLRSKISFTQNEVFQYEKDLSSAEYNMRTFDEYEKKRDILTEEYGLLETLRKAWSPTTGVPLIFIEGFMNNLLSSANTYLAEIWPDQELYIEGFTIDEKNFFINVKQAGSLIPHDASVCSGAERATLTTVLSLALLKQFPKIADMYNVTKFDEIDGTLDYAARKTFIGILNDLLDDIHCEQAFFISHSDTFQSDVDVILLKNSSEYEDRILNGQYNIIHRQ